MHTTKTPSFYLSCFALFVALTAFMAFNVWQLNVSLRFQNYLGESLAGVSNSSATSISTPAVGQQLRNVEQSNSTTLTASRFSTAESKMLHKMPIIHVNDVAIVGKKKVFCYNNNYEGEMNSPWKKALRY